MKEFKSMLLTRPEPGLMVVTLNRPESLNAIDTGHAGRSSRTSSPCLTDDESVKVVIITGAGPRVLRRRRPHGRGHP